MYTSIDRPILLVEDDPDDEMLMLEAISKNNIYREIKVVRDGVEALDYVFGLGEYANRVLPQVIILDLNLPKLGGLEVIKRLRDSKVGKSLPIIVLSTSMQDSDLAAAYDLGANSYIRKPIDFIQFIEKVRQLGQYWLNLNEYPSIQV